MPIDDADLGNLPDQITPGDSDANAATTFVLSRLQAWTGTVWQRVRTGVQTAANSLSVVLASDAKVPVTGIDDLARQRQLSVDRLGELATTPNIFNGVYLNLPRTLASQIVSVGNVSYFLDPDKWSQVLSGAGTVTFDPTFGEAELSVGGTAGDEALMLFNNAILYAAGHGIQARLAHRVDTPTATGLLREWGVFTDVGGAAATSVATGFYLEDGVFGVFFRVVGGGTVRIPQSSFAIDKLDGTGPSGVTIAPADLIHAAEYSIWIDWKLIFYVGDKPVTFVDFGTPSSSAVLTPVGNPPVVRLGYRIKSTATTGVPSHSWTHVAFGEAVGTIDATSEHYAEPSLSPITVQSGTTVPIFAIRAASTLGGVTMGKRVLPKRIGIEMSGPGRLSMFYGTSADIALTGAAFGAPSNAPGSGAEVDFAATAISAGPTARAVSSRSLVANVETLVDLTEIFGLGDLALTVRGDGTLVMLAVAVTNTSGGPCDATVRVFEWREIV